MTSPSSLTPTSCLGETYQFALYESTCINSYIRIHISWPMTSSRTPLLSFTSLSPIIGAIKVIFFLLIVESSFHRRETKRHHRHLFDETCGWPLPATYRFRSKCQASKRKNSNFLYPGIRSKYRSSQPPDFYFWYGNGNHKSPKSK